jgi:4-hydroxybenzoyl-CoA thioesterase/acyl-CoA thioester hydrolase
VVTVQTKYNKPARWFRPAGFFWFGRSLVPGNESELPVKSVSTFCFSYSVSTSKSVDCMSEKFKISRRVEFRETDMAGIVHFSNFFAYMEQAEHAFLREIGLGVICEIDGQKVSWPRVNAECNYRNAIRFEEIIDVFVSVTRIGTKSMTYSFEFFRDGTPVADGTITAVCCLFEHGKRPESVPIPAKFVDAVKPFVSAAD